jgi:two-component system cell cycle sensor histidine kinase/response regulator CckA
VQRHIVPDPSAVPHHTTMADDELLAQSDATTRLLEILPAGVLVVDKNGQLIYANPRAEQVLGLNRRQILERGYGPATWQLTVGGDEPSWQPGDAPLRSVISTGMSLRNQCGAVDLPDGRHIWISVNAAPLFDQAHQVDKVVVTVEDVTEQVQTQRALEESTHMYNALVEQVPAIVYVSAMDGIGTTLYISPQLEDIVGYKPEEWLADPELWIKRLHPDDRERMLSEFAQFLRSREPFRCEYRTLARDGRVVWVYEQAVALPEELGKQPVHQGIIVDVTARKQAEQAVREAEERYRSIVENAVVGVFRTSVEGKLIAVNPSMARLFGFASPEAMKQNVNHIGRDLYVDPEHRREIIEAASRDSAMHRFESEFRRTDGTIFTAQIDTRLVRAQDGSPLYVEGFMDDITERKRLEAQLRQAQKMEAVGRLAGGVAHDFNNLLTAIIGYSDLALGKMDAGDPLFKDVLEIKKAAEQAGALTSQLLAFSRKQMLQPRNINPNDVVTHVEKMLKRLIGEHIELVLDLDPHLCNVKADPGQMEQVIVNLAVNARDAMPRGGRLLIRTGNVQLDESFVRNHVGATVGQYAMLAISDTGDGMDAETMAHLFEPFFTTKEQGSGTGLGLATVYGIVKQSGGCIWADSKPGTGTTFAIYLPQLGAAAEPPVPDVLPQSAERPASETILVVEDNMSVRGLLCDVLEQLGYSVLQAADGVHALEVYESYNSRIHLLLSDIVMPGGVSGLDLAKHLTTLDPSMRVLLLSGYTHDAFGHDGALHGQIAFLQKPFAPDVLARRVREVLDAVRPSDEVRPGEG